MKDFGKFGIMMVRSFAIRWSPSVLCFCTFYRSNDRQYSYWGCCGAPGTHCFNARFCSLAYCNEYRHRDRGSHRHRPNYHRSPGEWETYRWNPGIASYGITKRHVIRISVRHAGDNLQRSGDSVLLPNWNCLRRVYMPQRGALHRRTHANFRKTSRTIRAIGSHSLQPLHCKL